MDIPHTRQKCKEKVFQFDTIGRVRITGWNLLGFNSDPHYPVTHHLKTYCLGPIQSRDTAAARLSALLPGQTQPWLLKDSSGNVLAYINLDDVEARGVLTISADISGRHYNCDAEVVSLLERLRASLGGVITDDT